MTSGNIYSYYIFLNPYECFLKTVITMSTDPPQVVNTGIFARYQNVVVKDCQFIEVLCFTIFHLDLVNNEDS